MSEARAKHGQLLKSRAPSWILLGAGVLLPLGCGQMASVVFDIPQTPSATAPAPAGVVATGAVVDTGRPPIEAVADRDSVLALLPKRASGAVDWDQAERDGTIQPRPAPPGAVRRYLEGFGYDLIMNQGGNPTFAAAFPHSRHVTQLTCETCHPGLFGGGTEDNSMRAMADGRSCGVCHGSVAFGTAACGRCHSTLPNEPAVTPTLGDDIIMARVGADSAQDAAMVFGPARFPHWTHRIRYRCSACHNTLFAMRAGADTLTMAAMNGGRACGACHDGAAGFPLTACSRCHGTSGP